MIQLDPIKLDEADVKRLNDLDTKRNANMAFAEQCRVAGERRNVAILEEGRDLWLELSKKYNLDPENVKYNLKDGALVVTAAQFPQNA